MAKKAASDKVARNLKARARLARMKAKACIRKKKVTRAELLLTRFEKALQSLERDPASISLFRERRVPKLEQDIKNAKARIEALEKQASHFSRKGKKKKAARIWRQIDFLEIQKRLMLMEKEFISQLK